MDRKICIIELVSYNRFILIVFKVKGPDYKNKRKYKSMILDLLVAIWTLKSNYKILKLDNILNLILPKRILIRIIMIYLITY